MKEQYKVIAIIGFIGMIILGGSLIVWVDLINNPIEPIEPDDPIDPIDPYIKGWETYHINVYSDDVYILNYTIPEGYVYYNGFWETTQGNHPYMYVVPSNLVDNFTDVWVNNNIDFRLDRLEYSWLEEIYNIKTYPRYYGEDFNFYPPYLDNWYIFLCANGGRKDFVYHDAIHDH